MTLATYESVEDLYLARGTYVNKNRPLFTGDVLRSVPVPGVQDTGMAIVIAHPCAMRNGAALTGRVLVAAVRPSEPIGPSAWTDGYFDRMPLPNLENASYFVAWLDDLGKACRSDIIPTERLACLSEFGINMLQQRLTFHLTRHEVPTFHLQAAFAHTHIEADLLEEWTDELTRVGLTVDQATERFDEFLRDGQPSLRQRLLNVEMRSSVRQACRREIQRLLSCLRMD